MRLLLGSGGFTTEERRARWKTAVDSFLGPVSDILFIPYAGADHDEYTSQILQRGYNSGRKFSGIHTHKDAKAAIQNCESLFIGGGNTFRLLNELYRFDLLDVIKGRVNQGMPLFAASAGSNVCGPTIKTTNDMPIVQPPRFEALNLVNFQINPHYFEGSVFYKSGNEMLEYGGETRDDRITEFHQMNETPVVGISEGAWLLIENNTLKLDGPGALAKIFRKNQLSQKITKENSHDLISLLLT
jgi:dipeptidase E